ncbi:uncharacterized protein B0H18DRAFT_165827 [Fomitopsis serialis]|uniref:uncharacterized protein n=1 Tax=Fomitopsis serialis TaxID=139415 RepID=UPI0020075C30|nr:uncharacterized protein B0H18DRAFT_165827 [Neoantrodia serialis]KAH9913505.1 hypothetical protein B0H18DRAFT_165827 [Neoantrodia serialis]
MVSSTDLMTYTKHRCTYRARVGEVVRAHSCILRRTSIEHEPGSSEAPCKSYVQRSRHTVRSSGRGLGSRACVTRKGTRARTGWGCGERRRRRAGRSSVKAILMSKDTG